MRPSEVGQLRREPSTTPTKINLAIVPFISSNPTLGITNITNHHKSFPPPRDSLTSLPEYLILLSGSSARSKQTAELTRSNLNYQFLISDLSIRLE